MYQIIVFAIPVFALLIAGEFVYGCYKQRNTYRLNDALSSLNQGLLSQMVAVCTQFFQIGLYAGLYELVALYPRAAFWDSWYGWLIAIVLFDFCDYWLHRMGHESAIFWAAHVVHHQSQEFNFSTALRQESTVALLGWVFYAPMAIVGVPPEEFAIAGLVVLLYQFWIHTEHVGKLGWFDRVFSSPSNHRVHHAVNDQYIDRNYGGMLVIWDRMFGTFAEEKEPCVYGTRVQLDSWNPGWAVAHTYASLFHDVWHARSWLDKFRILFKPPGWRPAELEARFPRESFTLDKVTHYDPPHSKSAGWLAAGLFTVILAAWAVFLWVADDLGWPRAALSTLALGGALWAVGALLEGRLGKASSVVLASAATAIGVWAPMQLALA
ncbi:MAG: sterol desaturase family protein [Burkholderiales bacterium]|nr:sterol desaturase family protein [Burkholderiales bacterium]